MQFITTILEFLGILVVAGVISIVIVNILASNGWNPFK